jgi:hypothetical protein
MSSKYLGQAAMENILGTIIIDPSFLPLSQDSYDEKAVLIAIAKTGRQDELFYCAVNLAVMGFGGKKFGNFLLHGKITDIASIMQECGIRIGLSKDAKIEPSDLTPGRLCRAFRYQIRSYLKTNLVESYLFKKYSDKNPDYLHILFRGAEYLDDLTKDQGDVILMVHERLDTKLGTTMAERISTIFAAKAANQRIVASTVV